MKILMLSKSKLAYNEYSFYDENKQLLYYSKLEKRLTSFYQLLDKDNNLVGTIRQKNGLSSSFLMCTDVLNEFLISPCSVFSDSYDFESLNWKLTIPTLRKTIVIVDKNNNAALVHAKHIAKLSWDYYIIDYLYEEDIVAVMLSIILADIVYQQRQAATTAA